MEITGTFDQVLFDVNVTEVGNGSVAKNSSGQVTSGQQVTLNRHTGCGLVFSGWSGDLTGDDNPEVITVKSDQDITATFIQYGAITIKKETDPAGGSGFTFNGDLGAFGLNDNGSKTFNNLETGDYDVTESVPTGWRFVDVSCTGGDSTNIINSIQVNLDPGKSITCTFNNSQKGTITIGNQTKPDLGTWFAYTGDFGNFSLKDGLAQLFSNLEVDTYDVLQTADSFWELIDVECSGGDTTVILGGVRIDLDPGEAVTCNFLNQPKNGIYLPLMIVDN